MSKKYKKVDVVVVSIIINLSQTSLPDIVYDYRIVFLDNFCVRFRLLSISSLKFC